MSTQALRPHPPGRPAGEPPTARAHARTKATRLLSAGTYLDPGYRRAVVRELFTHHFRVVAPSYGYDAVSVLAHALAARRLHRIQSGVAAGSALVLLLLMSRGTLGPFMGVQLLCWVLWGSAYLRRLVTLHILMTRLKETGPDGGFDGSYPATGELTDDLIRKIDHEQSTQDGLVLYGGFRPFVGAGEQLRDWSNAQLLLGAPRTRIAARQDFDGSGPGLDEVERRSVLPFTVHDITAHVAARMRAELRDEARRDERIEGLTVEQRRYTTAIRTNDRTVGAGWSQLPGAGDLPAIHWREDYDSAREYLCVRVASWNEELVTSVFVGFDLKGDTLHTEFHTYVLGPLVRDFHLVDLLPGTFDGSLALRVARDTLTAGVRRCLALSLWPLRLLPERFLPPPVRAMVRPGQDGRTALRFAVEGAPADSSEFRLGRYANDSVDCGALTSVREMATSDTFHHFFQKSDALKYTQIVERRLLHNIRLFLKEHNVDLADHDRAQTNILFGDNTQAVFGGHNENFGYNHQPADPHSPGSRGAQSS
ncbi:hypothetical protein QFZ75_002896 [Streptomyces sp. V3I8]|uniref:hypothetical protein n=1 Tax=Streptomyces sp. V3I8 TaxID=3042279 RepID=UPI0027833DDB|nr:hypothetical protein [Streptomyces sp. V3I8]MDQ1036480.1 hypothetical protein [Streptomyces sp. V3I8]